MNPDPVVVNSGDTAWMMISTALVLLMTPGLAFFYGGMVQTRNVVATLFQSVIAIGVVGLLWAVCGYSLVFSGDHAGLIGNLDWAFLRGVGQTPNADYAATIPHEVFMLFQCMFAIITPALITGAFAERVRFKAWLAISALWSLLIYVPVAHSVWGVGGALRDFGAIDFAGGLVVHMTAGYSALVFAKLLRPRQDFGKNVLPHDTGMVLLGTALLWFGWFGFNAGSALASNGLAGHAFANTFIAGASAMLSWVLVDLFTRGKPTLFGACIGAVAGLVAITPAAGFVTLPSGIAIGLITGVACNYAIAFFKQKLKLDDTLDVFGCHGIGGTIGTILTGVFATKSVNPAGADGLLYGNPSLLKAQLLSSLIVVVVGLAGTFLVVKVVALFTPIQIEPEEEQKGLDSVEHAETIQGSISILQELWTRASVRNALDSADRNALDESEEK
jgi:Amt family ammonium transporter